MATRGDCEQRTSFFRLTIDSNSNYTVHLLESQQDLESLKADWILLYEQVQPRNPFLSYEWAQAWWSCLCPAATPFLLTLRSAGRLVGLAALRLERKRGFRMLRFLADGRADYLGFLLAPGHTHAAGLLLDNLYQHRSRWDIAVLRQLNDVSGNPGGCPLTVV